jgi:hypothetical protein
VRIEGAAWTPAAAGGGVRLEPEPAAGGWEAPVLLLLALGLLSFGLVAVYSASSVLAVRLGLADPGGGACAGSRPARRGGLP